MAKNDNTQVIEKIQYSFVPNHRDTMQALARATFNIVQIRMIIAVMNQTDGFLREDDELSTGKWQSITLLGRQSLNLGLRSLLDLKVLAQNESRYRLNHPNLWDPAVFKPQHISRRAVVTAKALLEEEHDKQSYGWLKKALSQAETSLVSDDSSSDPPKNDPPSEKANPPKEPAPYYAETKSFLDRVAEKEGIKFLDFPKLLKNTRAIFVATKASVDDLLDCYDKMKAEAFWGRLTPSQRVMHLKEHFAVYLKLKAEGKLNDFLKAGGDFRKGGRGVQKLPSSYTRPEDLRAKPGQGRRSS